MGEFEQEEITTLDGYLIVSRSFAREGAARGGVLIVPAMGVAQSYYEPFAAWLADRGYVAVTFDFRGIGLSRAGPLRALKTDILSWARFDCAAVLDRLAERIGDTPLYWIGHSLGGQIIPLVPNWGRVSKFITIATGSGYWRKTPRRLIGTPGFYGISWRRSRSRCSVISPAGDCAWSAICRPV